MINQRVNHLTLADKVYEEIKKDILVHKIAPGSKLGESMLSEMYQVSATPIREALKRLRSDGFLEYQPYGGHVLKQITLKEICDIYDVRSSLEILALQQAFPFITKEDLILLEQNAMQTVEKITGKEDEFVISYNKWNDEFHQFFIEKSMNSWITKTMKSINDYLFWIRVPLTKTKRSDQSQSEHLSIINALKKDQVNEAISLLSNHIRRVKQEVIDFEKLR